MASSTTVTPVLHRARTGNLVTFAINGFALASWLSRVPDVKAALELTPGLLAILLLGMSVGALIGLPVAGRLTHRLGAARTVRLGMIVEVPGLILAATAIQLKAPLWMAVVPLVLVGLGSGVWDVAMNLEGTVIEQGLARAIMPWFHAAFSGGTVLGALIGALIVYLQVPLLIHLSVVSILIALAAWWGTSAYLPAFDEDSDEHTTTPATKHRSAWTEPRTLIIGVMVLAAAFTEGTANDWMAVAFVDGHHLDPALGVIGLAVFLTFMTAGRILGTRWLDKYGRIPVLRAMFASAIVGCLLVVFGPTWLAFLGAAIWGVGASLGFPVGMSAAADEPHRAHARLSVVSTIGYLAFLAGPPLLGFLGDRVGVLRSLLVVAVISAAALLVVPVTKPLPGAVGEGSR